jgi:hypothetical protein
MSSVAVQLNVTPPVNTGTEPAQISRHAQPAIPKMSASTIANLRHAPEDISIQQDVTMGAIVDNQEKLGLAVQKNTPENILPGFMTNKTFSSDTLVTSSNAGNLEKNSRTNTPAPFKQEFMRNITAHIEAMMAPRRQRNAT